MYKSWKSIQGLNLIILLSRRAKKEHTLQGTHQIISGTECFPWKMMFIELYKSSVFVHT